MNNIMNKKTKPVLAVAIGRGTVETTHEMSEAFEAVLPQALLEKLDYFKFSFAISDRNGLGIILECQIGIPDDVDYCPLTKYVDKDVYAWPGFSSEAVSSPEYQARIKELRIPAAIAPQDFLEYYEQWNEYNEYVVYDCFRYNAKYYIPLEDVSIPSIIKAAKIFAGYDD